jgi:four helix bundle protein
VANPIFDHDKLDVYRLAIEYVADSFGIAKQLSGLHRHARDQWVRAAQSIPLNIAEGNGKRSLKDRSRFFDIARGSALECAAIQDVLIVSGGMNAEIGVPPKAKLKRIVAMLTRLVMRSDLVTEASASYTCDYDYEHETKVH